MTTIVKVETAMIVGAVLAFIGLAVTMKVLQVRGIVPNPEVHQRAMFPVIMLIFVVFSFSLIGLAFHAFVTLQGDIGNADRGPIPFLRRNEAPIVVGVWLFMLLGVAIAYPVMSREMLGPAPPAIGPSKGILRADVGMTMDEVRAGSTLPVAPTRPSKLTNSTQTIGEVVFDFEIGGVRLENCRYYFVTTGSNGDPHIDSINIGISPYKKPHPAIDADEEAVRTKLAANGWLPGRFVWRTKKELQLSGGKPTSGEGRYWAKNGTLIILSTRRMDDEKAGEPSGAGEFILIMDVVPKEKESYAALEYGPAPTAPPH